MIKEKHHHLLKKRDWRIAISVFLSGLSCFGLLYYYQALLPALSVYFKVDQATSSLAISSATLGMAIGLVTTMFVADRYNRRHVVGFSLLGATILAFIGSYQDVFWVLIVLNFFKGFLLAGTTSVCLAYIAEEVSETRKIQITGFYIAGNAIGGMLGRVLSSNIAHLFAWQTASEVMGITCLFFAVLFFILSPESKFFKPHKESFKTLIKPNIKLIFNSQFFPYYFTGFLLLGAFVSLYNYMAFFMTNSPFNIPKSLMSYVYILYLTGVLGAMNVPFWEKQCRTPQHALKVISILGILGIAILFLENLFFVVMGIGIFTYCFFVAHTICSKMVGNLSQAKKSVSIAIYLLSYYMGSSILGSSTGILLARYQWQFFLILIMFLFGMVFIVFSLKKVGFNS